MTQEIITRTKLTAAAGMMLTNGDVIGKEVFLGTGDTADNWHEITEAEAQEIMNVESTEEIHPKQEVTNE